MGAANPAEFLALAASVTRPDFSALHAYTEQLGGIATKRLVALPVLSPLTPAAPAAPFSGAVEAPPEALAAALAEAPVDNSALAPVAPELAGSILLDSVASTPLSTFAPDVAESAPAQVPHPSLPDEAPKVSDEGFSPRRRCLPKPLRR